MFAAILANRSVEACLLAIFLVSGCARVRPHPPGGYAYPAAVQDADTDYFFLPIRKLVPRKDSLLYASGNYEYRMFHEPNLSIRYLGREEYRLWYDPALSYPTMIVLTPGRIVVKRETGGLPYPKENDSLLDPLERLHYHILRYRFPLEAFLREYNGSVKWKRYVDSLIQVYPQLLSPAYYHYLVKKAIDPHVEPFTYYEKTYAINEHQYRYLVGRIDSSGYWSLPYRLDCKSYPTDGDGFTLEANTPGRYNIVSRPGCAGESGLALAKACQELVGYAHKTDSIHLYRDRGSGRRIRSSE